MQTLSVTAQTARWFLCAAFGLSTEGSFRSVSEAIQSLEFVQEDSISVCGRMHDLILRPRLQSYTPELLAQTLYGPEASAFEYGFPNLCALPHADFPHFARKMQARAATPGRWHGLLDDELPIAERFLAALDERGPLRTRAHGSDDGHMLSGWGSRATVVSQVAEKLWLHGTLSIARRENFERYFDRTERVYPALHAARTALPDPEDSARYLARKRLRAKRLFRPKRDELALLGEKAFGRVEIEGLTKPWFCLAEDAALLTHAPRPHITTLLAPLDPLVYDRVRTRELFGFDYTWEVYVPEAKRKWGYYVLPILHDDQLIGRLDPKFDRKTATLHIKSLVLEPGVSIGAVATPIAQAVEHYAQFLGAESIQPLLVPPEICKSLAT